MKNKSIISMLLGIPGTHTCVVRLPSSPPSSSSSDFEPEFVEAKAGAKSSYLYGPAKGEEEDEDEYRCGDRKIAVFCT